MIQRSEARGCNRSGTVAVLVVTTGLLGCGPGIALAGLLLGHVGVGLFLAAATVYAGAGLASLPVVRPI